MVILSKNVVDNGCSTNDGEAGVSGNDQQSEEAETAGNGTESTIAWRTRVVTDRVRNT